MQGSRGEPAVSARRMAIWFLLVRTSVFAVLAIAGVLGGEVASTIFLDLPTVGVYAVLSTLGINLDVQNHLDLAFHIIGSATWLALGALVGLFLGMLRQPNRRKRYPRRAVR